MNDYSDYAPMRLLERELHDVAEHPHWLLIEELSGIILRKIVSLSEIASKTEKERERESQHD
jgi:hypothetical protein